MLTRLNISKNNIGVEGAEAIAGALKAQQQHVCADGQLFKSKGAMARSTCKRCGKQKVTHDARGALKALNIRDNNISDNEMSQIRDIHCPRWVRIV